MQLTRIQKVGIAGGCIFLFSILLQTAILPGVIKSQVKKKVALKKDWTMRNIWGKFPFSIGVQIYIFNITNPDGITNGEKPIVKEVGPYCYDQFQEKTNQIDHEEDDTVSYTLRNTYYFNAANSARLTGEEEVIVPNYFAIALVNIVLREKPNAVSLLDKALNSIFNNPTNLFMKAKVKDILFEGLLIDCNVTDFSASAACAKLKTKIEELNLKVIAENKYTLSLLGHKNGTDSKARTRVYRGIKNIMDVGKVTEYNGKPNISVWNNKYCDTFNGTDGTIFHPFFDKNGKDDVVAFNPDLCRSISCQFESKTTFSGLNLLRYTADLGTNGNDNPLHKCYCQKPDMCLKKGAFDLYQCQKKPIIITNPHFYLADPYYLNLVDGLNPVKENHMMIVDIDPFTGTPIHVHTRVQLNMFITKLREIKQMEKFPDALLPLAWYDEIIILPDFLIKEIQFGHKLATTGKVLQYLLMFGGIFLCGFSGYKHYKSNKIK